MSTVGRIFPIAVVVVSVAVVASIGGFVSEHHHQHLSKILATKSAFGWLSPSQTPSGWNSVKLPFGEAVLSFPPSYHLILGDAGSISAAVVDQRGHYLAYLNVTPQYGGEKLRNWSNFRITHLIEERDLSVHEIAEISDVPFRRSVGSCVFDSYVTHIAHNRYSEISCLVKGHQSGIVIVAAASTPEWTHFKPQLEKAVTSIVVG